MDFPLCILHQMTPPTFLIFPDNGCKREITLKGLRGRIRRLRKWGGRNVLCGRVKIKKREKGLKKGGKEGS